MAEPVRPRIVGRGGGVQSPDASGLFQSDLSRLTIAPMRHRSYRRGTGYSPYPFKGGRVGSSYPALLCWNGALIIMSGSLLRERTARCRRRSPTSVAASFPLSEANVNITTHALHYGTAVFEGIRGNWNEDQSTMFVFRPREHYARLVQGCRIMLMDIPYSVDDFLEITKDLVRQCGYREDVYIRPIVYKSEEKVANLKLQELATDFALVIVPFGSYIEAEGAIRCMTSSWRRIDDTMIPPRVKISGHYVNSILAKTEATLAGFDEAIFMNQDGSVSEGSGENLFIVTNGTIHTPLVEENNLTGITRDSAWQLAEKELGMKVVERRIRRSELYLADEVFLTGTAAHVTPVGEIDNRPIGNGEIGPVTKSLSDLYLSLIRGNNPTYSYWCTAIPLEEP